MELKVHGDVAGDLEGWQFDRPLERFDPNNWMVVETGEIGTTLVELEHGMLLNLEDFADHVGVSAEEMRRHFEGENRANEGGVTVDGEFYPPKPLEEIGVEPDQGEDVQKTVRNLDRTGLEVVRKRLGVGTDAEVVRACVRIAKQVLTRG